MGSTRYEERVGPQPDGALGKTLLLAFIVLYGQILTLSSRFVFQHSADMKTHPMSSSCDLHNMQCVGLFGLAIAIPI